MAYIDSISLDVCHPKCITRNKVFKVLAEIEKLTKGWFFGLKLHIIDDKGNFISALTKGNVDDRSVVPQMTADMHGFLFAYKRYICRELFIRLLVN